MASLTRSIASASSVRSIARTPIARASLATSSRVGLDFTLPRRAESDLLSSLGSTGNPSPPSSASSSTSKTPSSSSSSTKPLTLNPPIARRPPITVPLPRSATGLGASGSSNKSKYRHSTARVTLNTTTGSSFSPSSHSHGSDLTHVLSIHCTRNNTHITFSDKIGPLIPTISCGTGKAFKNSQRASYEAAYQAALKMISKVSEVSQDIGLRGSKVLLTMRGFGGTGREAVTAALEAPEGQEVSRMIGRVEDRTGIKIGGTRARRPRRL